MSTDSIRKKNTTYYTGVGVGQYHMDGGCFTLGSRQCCLGGLQANLETPDLTNQLGVKVTGLIYLTKETLGIISTVGVGRAGGEACWG